MTLVRPIRDDADKDLDEVVEARWREVVDRERTHDELVLLTLPAVRHPEVAVVLHAGEVEVRHVAAVVDDSLCIGVREADTVECRVLERRLAIGDSAELERPCGDANARRRCFIWHDRGRTSVSIKEAVSCMRALATLAAAALLALVAAVGVSASSFVPDPLVQVSGASPFAGCTADAGQPGIVYVNSEVEPWIDVNPTNPNNLVGIWQQDRWDNGGARGLVAGRSVDGGLSVVHGRRPRPDEVLRMVPTTAPPTRG